jgi:hypothetical protein
MPQSEPKLHCLVPGTYTQCVSNACLCWQGYTEALPCMNVCRPVYARVYVYDSGWNAGTELTLTVAVDFTLSNGAPTEPTSLHNMRTDGGWNTYQQALISVSEILVCAFAVFVSNYGCVIM